MKRTLILLVTILLIFSISPYKAYAALSPSLGAYSTDEGITVGKNVFGWDETPFTFIQFNVDDLTTERALWLNWSWYFGTETTADTFIATESQRITNFPDTPFLNIWNAVDNWNSYKQVGEWTTAIRWENDSLGGKGGFGSQTVNSTVTPEPGSAILFLIGAAALGARHYRKKRKTA